MDKLYLQKKHSTAPVMQEIHQSESPFYRDAILSLIDEDNRVEDGDTIVLVADPRTRPGEGLVFQWEVAKPVLERPKPRLLVNGVDTD